MNLLWAVKTRRAQTVEDNESWAMGGVVPTLNVFDNAHETRATVIVFYGNRVDDIRIQDDKINTLQARMGTGGNNMPMVYQEGEDETVAYSIREDAQADTFSATPTDTALALQAHQPSVQSHHAQLFVAQTAEPMVLQDREGKPGGGKGPLVSDTSFSLRTSNFQTLFTSTVRRLTPTECERLQGFPDGWTEGQADSHRYKQLGNAVAVPVVDWLISRLVASNESMESSTE